MARGVVGKITWADTGIEGEILKARAANIALIDKMARGYGIAVREVLEDLRTTGDLRVETVRDMLRARAGITARHADLIARDQTLKLNAAITRIRMINAGVTHYTWNTSHDERVRPSHQALDGQVFSWAVGTPIGYHPGEDYRCRCVAIPYFEDLGDEDA